MSACGREEPSARATCMTGFVFRCKTEIRSSACQRALLHSHSVRHLLSLERWFLRQFEQIDWLSACCLHGGVTSKVRESQFRFARFASKQFRGGGGGYSP